MLDSKRGFVFGSYKCKYFLNPNSSYLYDSNLYLYEVLYFNI